MWASKDERDLVPAFSSLVISLGRYNQVKWQLCDIDISRQEPKKKKKKPKKKKKEYLVCRKYPGKGNCELSGKRYCKRSRECGKSVKGQAWANYLRANHRLPLHKFQVFITLITLASMFFFVFGDNKFIYAVRANSTCNLSLIWFSFLFGRYYFILNLIKNNVTWFTHRTEWLPPTLWMFFCGFF